jgi:hypothetical protein
MHTPLHTRSLLLCTSLALATVTCASVDPGERNGQGPRLLVCTATDAPTGSVRKVVGPDSGRTELEIGGPRGRHRLTIPRGAVTKETTFILTARPSDRVQVEAHAEGHETFAFANGQRATLRLDAGHCPAAFDRLQGKQIVRVEGDKLVPVGGTAVSEGTARRPALQAELPTLSGYAIAGS